MSDLPDSTLSLRYRTFALADKLFKRLWRRVERAADSIVAAARNLIWAVIFHWTHVVKRQTLTRHTIPAEGALARYFRANFNPPVTHDQTGKAPPAIEIGTLPKSELLKNARAIDTGSNTYFYDPVGRCIYCDSVRYKPGANRPLGQEHIISEALGGTLILPEASCHKCEGITSSIEGSINRTMLGAPRRRLGLIGKARRGRPGHISSD